MQASSHYYHLYTIGILRFDEKAATCLEKTDNVQAQEVGNGHYISCSPVKVLQPDLSGPVSIGRKGVLSPGSNKCHLTVVSEMWASLQDELELNPHTHFI